MRALCARPRGEAGGDLARLHEAAQVAAHRAKICERTSGLCAGRIRLTAFGQTQLIFRHVTSHHSTHNTSCPTHLKS